MWTWALPIASGVLFVVLFGRYNLRAALRDWDALLAPTTASVVLGLQQSVELDAFLAHRTFGKALDARRRLQIEESLRLLDRAVQVIAQAIPDRLSRLRGMAICARMASAILPVPQLIPGGLRLRPLATLAGAAGLLHHMLVSMEERYWLRLAVLGLCYRIVCGVCGRAASRAAWDAASSAPWQTFELAIADFRTLDHEHVESFRRLLVSLAAG